MITFLESGPATPMFFVLFPGADITKELEPMCRQHDYTIENGRAQIFCKIFGGCQRRLPRTNVDLKAPKDASHRDFSDATLRFDLALGVRRRHAPNSC